MPEEFHKERIERILTFHENTRGNSVRRLIRYWAVYCGVTLTKRQEDHLARVSPSLATILRRTIEIQKVKPHLRASKEEQEEHAIARKDWHDYYKSLNNYQN